jgi:hypothetical protein
MEEISKSQSSKKEFAIRITNQMQAHQGEKR